ncbi:MAG: GNAT family N-acetyltransferase [Cellulosilyticaceae bacterium]
MYFTHYTDSTLFAEEVLDLLLEKEVQNNLLIGNTIRHRDHPDTEGLMATIKDDEGHILVTAVLVVPFNLTIYETDNIPKDEALKVLAGSLYEKGLTLPGVIGEVHTARRFAAFYCEIAGQVAEDGLGMNLYELRQVIPHPPVTGHLRAATKQDIYFLPYWQVQYVSECGLGERPLDKAIAQIEALLTATPVHYLWEDEVPVSLAAIGRKLMNGVAISNVYTPPTLRGKGYASACVGELCEKLLGEGYTFICLFADIKNPISNKVYTRVGFTHLCIYQEISFGSPQ